MLKSSARLLLITYGAFALWVTPCLYRAASICKTDQQVEAALSCCSSPSVDNQCNSDQEEGDDSPVSKYCLLCSLISYGQEPPALPPEGLFHLGEDRGSADGRTDGYTDDKAVLTGSPRAPPA